MDDQNTQSEEELSEEERLEEEARALQEQAETEALIAVFDQVRMQSGKGKLLASSYWEEEGLVPEHLSSQEFRILIDQCIQDAQAKEPSEEKVKVQSATTAVGIPKFGRKSNPEEDTAPLPDPDETKNEDEVEVEDESPSNEDETPGYELVEIEGELTLIPLEVEEQEATLDASGIAALSGKKALYLYDQSLMTDVYARWAFLAAEDDRVLTFVECVRDESRTYPRPMSAKGLYNEPFSLTKEEVEDIWHAVSESGEYEDIAQTAASNGDVYYYSTEYLSPEYAASLAEWQAVEQEMYL